MRHLLIFLLAILGFTACQPAPAPLAEAGDSPAEPLFVGQELDTTQLLQTIAVGSCNRQDLPQDIWAHILEHNPEMWVWLGDNIYGDSDDMLVMRAKYLQQKYAPEYVAFRQKMPVLGIWDDHDYGLNNGGKEYAARAESQALMLDFLDVPPSAAVRQQAGAYQAYTFGPSGKKVKIILLDSRYHRDAPIKNPAGKGYLGNEEGTILGETQWQWLEAELANSDAQVHLIGNGIQVIPAEHDYEKWENFPQERERLFALLKQYEVKHPVLLSGDRHIAEISRLDYSESDYPVYEMTSSGLTHSYEAVGAEPNQYRVSDLIGQKNFGLIKIDWTQPDAPGIVLEVWGKEQVLFAQVAIEK